MDGTVTLSPGGQWLYESLRGAMESSGDVDLNECLELNQEALARGLKLVELVALARELEVAGLAFRTEEGRWRVRLPPPPGMPR